MEDNLPCRFPRDRKFECPVGYVNEYSGARILFLIGRNSATKLLKMSTDIKQKIERSKQLSELYMILAYYEGQRFLKENTYNRLSKMHKRRVTLWKTLVNQQNGNAWKRLLLLGNVKHKTFQRGKFWKSVNNFFTFI